MGFCGCCWLFAFDLGVWLGLCVVLIWLYSWYYVLGCLLALVGGWWWFCVSVCVAGSVVIIVLGTIVLVYLCAVLVVSFGGFCNCMCLTGCILRLCVFCVAGWFVCFGCMFCGRCAILRLFVLFW